MPIRPEQLFDAAQRLNAMKPPLVSDEVCARTMANRAYYAAYLATREALRAQYGNPRFDVAHGSLAYALTTAPDPDVRALGARLQTLKAIREDSDYEPGATVSKLAVALHLADASYVLEKAAKLVGKLPMVTHRK